CLRLNPSVERSGGGAVSLESEAPSAAGVSLTASPRPIGRGGCDSFKGGCSSSPLAPFEALRLIPRTDDLSLEPVAALAGWVAVSTVRPATSRCTPEESPWVTALSRV